MQSSESSSSLRERISKRLYHPAAVIVLRIIIGGLFIFSGFVKAVDPWGSCIKIGEYFTAWGIDMPQPLVTCCSFLLAGYEFVWGAMLLLGCYKRCSVWCLTLMMASMLPLTLYIAVADPVDDCGCLGDYLVISNTATFVKNIFITLGLIYLLLFNRRCGGLFVPYVQWVIGGIVTLYILIIELVGFNVQPLIDFRRFAPGEKLVSTTIEESDGETVYEYGYEKDGEYRTFTIDNLPDSTWTFVDRTLIGGSETVEDDFTILDEEGDNIAPDIIAGSGGQFIVTIPDISAVDLSCTYLINELNEYMVSHGESLVAFISSDSIGMEWWKDVSMASYPIFQGDPKLLKELARGNAALVYMEDGIVKWKRTLSSISYTQVTETPGNELLGFLDPEPGYVLRLVTIFFLTVLAILLILDRSGKMLAWHLSRKSRKAPESGSA